MDEIGGAQIHLRDIALEYRRQGHDVTILSGSLGNLTNILQDAGIKIHHISLLKRAIHPVYDLFALAQLVMVMRRIKPSVVACHSSQAGLLGRLAAWVCGVPSVFTVHGWAFTDGVPNGTARIYRILEKAMARITNHVITVSQYDKNLALKYGIMPDDKMTVVHNGIPDVEYIERSIALNENPFRMLMVARFGAQKDHRLLLETLARCTDLNWTLDLVGGGDAEDCMTYCNRNHLADRVHFLGERRDVANRFRNVDGFLLISNWEGLPISILEAMRAALPVIASDVGGVSEAVIDKVTGYLVPRGDSQALEAAIRQMIGNRNQSMDFGRAGRAAYLQSFGFCGMVKETLAIYNAVRHVRT